MTGTHDAPTGAASAGGPATHEDEATELAAYLAAENVANDYHHDELPPDHLAG